MTPAQIQALVEQLTPIQARFRKASSPLSAQLNTATFTALGQQQPVQISSVGLGYALLTEWTFTLSIVNSATQAETFEVSPLFPYCLVTNSQVQINGGATVLSASGIGTYATMTRQRKGSRALSQVQNNGSTGAFITNAGLDPALYRNSTMTNLTPTAASASTTPAFPTLSGISTISVAGSSTGTWTFSFYTVEKLALDRDSMLGALPLQNNSTFANLTRTIVSTLSGTWGSSSTQLTLPFSAAGAQLTFSLTTATAKTTYLFCSVPSDPALYAPMVQNSYQIQEQTGITVTATGAQGFSYNIPQNAYLLAASIYGADTNGVVVPYSWLDPLILQYNSGTIQPVTQYQGRERAWQRLNYNYDPANTPGLRYWDGEETSDDLNASDDMGWLNTYAAASPQLVGTVASTISTNVAVALTREQIVAGSVSVIGG